MNNYANLQSADFQAAIGQRLLPRGLAWTRQLGSVLQGFWATIAGALAAVQARSAALTEREGFPPTSVELLPDWEEVLDLPDPCLGSNPSTPARQAAVAARLGATGGQSVPYFEQLATNLGATISVTEYAPFRLGVDHFGGGGSVPVGALRCAAWAHRWLVTLSGVPFFKFKVGVSHLGEPFWQIAKSPVQCEIQRLAPAHTLPTFSGF